MEETQVGFIPHTEIKDDWTESLKDTIRKTRELELRLQNSGIKYRKKWSTEGIIYIEERY